MAEGKSSPGENPRLELLSFPPFFDNNASVMIGNDNKEKFGPGELFAKDVTLPRELPYQALKFQQGEAAHDIGGGKAGGLH